MRNKVVLLALALLAVDVTLDIVATAAAAQTSKYGIPASNGSGATVLPVSTVAGLPICDVSHLGLLRAVSDATAPAFGAILAGGGAVGALAYCNGTNWTAR